MTPAAAAAARSRRRRPWRWLALALLAVLALPYLVVPLYRVLPPVSTVMLWRWATGARVEQRHVALAALPPAVARTVLAAEDARFCRHAGVDLGGLREAIEDAASWQTVRGGSTITQQVAKNLFLWPQRSLLRKGLELPLALWIDLVLPKRRILEIYLNIAEWGPDGEFGIEAGARRAFGKPAARLTPQEAALMAAILPNPRRRSAAQPNPGIRRLAGIYAARARTQDDGCL